jgi:hypothetical protein
LRTNGGTDFEIEFSQPISAFGFYGTDIGDINGDLILQIENGGTKSFTLSTGGDPDGSLLFWGFIDSSETYSKIKFVNTGPGDSFGFDDMTIGDPGQVKVATVPEPNSIACLLMIGATSLTVRRRR